MSAAEIWLVIAAITLATVVTRSAMLLVAQRLELPHALVTALRYAPGCALAAIVLPDAVLQHGHVSLGPGNDRLVATCFAVMVFVVTRGTLSTIVGGMLALWAVRWFLA